MSGAASRFVRAGVLLAGTLVAVSCGSAGPDPRAAPAASEAAASGAAPPAATVQEEEAMTPPEPSAAPEAPAAPATATLRTATFALC